MVWYNRLQPFLNRSRRAHSFAFSGCGWLTPFHLGVICRMKEKGYINDTTICSGTSGGALAALVATSNINCDDALDQLIKISTDKSFKKDIHAGLRNLLKSILPSDGLIKCNGRLYICVTKIWPNPRNTPDIINHYTSEDHLLDVVVASCFIPFYSNPSMLATKIHTRQEFYIDGGVSAWMPPIGDIKVSPFPPKIVFWRLNASEVNIHLETNAYPVPKLIQWILIPPSAKILEELYEHGKNSAQKWIDANNHNSSSNINSHDNHNTNNINSSNSNSGSSNMSHDIVIPISTNTTNDANSHIHNSRSSQTHDLTYTSKSSSSTTTSSGSSSSVHSNHHQSNPNKSNNSNNNHSTIKNGRIK